VTQPSGRVLTYRHLFEDGADGKTWILTERTLVEGSTTVSRIAPTYRDITFVDGHPLKVVDRQDTTQDGVTFTTDPDYAESNFGDYLQPWRITESASTHGVTRVTERTFQYGFTPYLKPKVSQQTLTVSGESFTTSVGYNMATGFPTSQTTAGMTTQVASDSFGNAASVTDPQGHQTTTASQWGVAATVTTPSSSVTRTINADGSVASENRAGAVTTFAYDAAGRMTSVAPPDGAPTTTSYATDGSSVTVSRADRP